MGCCPRRGWEPLPVSPTGRLLLAQVRVRKEGQALRSVASGATAAAGGNAAAAASTATAGDEDPGEEEYDYIEVKA